MSVGLGDLLSNVPDVEDATVWAQQYDADVLYIEQDGQEIELCRKQLQELSIIIDRFQDR